MTMPRTASRKARTRPRIFGYYKPSPESDMLQGIIANVMHRYPKKQSPIEILLNEFLSYPVGNTKQSERTGAC
jgi:hypothetical protein